MDSASSPTVSEILAGLGVTSYAGEILIEGAGGVSTSVGVPATIGNLVVIDTGAVDATIVTATLSTKNNPLVIASGSAGTLSTSRGGLTVSFTGTVSQLDADLKLLSYVSNSAVNDSIILSFSDSAENSKTVTIPITVLPSFKITSGPTKAIYVNPTSTGQNATLAGGDQIYVADNGSDSVAGSSSGTSVTGGGAGSNMTLVQTGGSYNYVNGAGSATVVANAAPGTIHGGAAGSKLVAFLQNQPTVYIGGQGDDELIAGSGAFSVSGGNGGSLTVFGGSGTLNYVGGRNDHETLVGGTGAETIHAAATGGAYFGGSGGSQMFATGSGTFLIGAVGGDVLTASAFGGDGLVAGAGNETLNGGGSRWENVFFGGSGADMVMLGQGADSFVGGSGADVIQMGSGSAALFAGAGAMLLAFDAAHTASGNGPGQDFVAGFRVGTDHLRLSGGLTVASYGTSGGSTDMRLSDGTHLHLAGVTGAAQSSLFG